MSRTHSHSKRKHAEINIVPLVDVLIVVIFFILMSMQIRQPRVVNITPPEMETAGENKASDPILIAVDKEGQFYYNNEPVSGEELQQLLKTAAELGDASQRVLSIVDEDTPVKKLTFVLDMTRKYGFENVRMQTR